MVCRSTVSRAVFGRLVGLLLGLLGTPCSGQQSGVGAPPQAARGVVVDGEGVPVPGAAVSFYAFDAPLPTQQILDAPQTRSDAAGRYELGIPRDVTGYLAVTAPGRQVCTLAVTMNHHPAGYRAILLSGHVLHGRLRDGGGKPVVGAVVTVSDAIDLVDGGACKSRSVATSDERGIFSVPGVPGSGLKVAIEARDYRPVQVFANRGSPLDLTLDKCPWLRGVVVDHDGRAVPDAHVAITAASRLPIYQATRTDSAGRFELPCSAEFPFRVTAAGGRYSSALLTEPVDEVRLEPDASHRWITVHVVDAITGKAIERFSVSVGGANTDAFDLQSARQQHLTTTQGGRPGGRVCCFRASRYAHAWVMADAEGYGFELVPLPDGKDEITLALEREAPLTGIVVDEAGDPVPGAAVRALPVGLEKGFGSDLREDGVRTDATGAFSIPRLRAGEYHVQAFADGRRTSPPRVGRAAVDGAAPCRVTLPAPTVVRLKFGGVGSSGLSPAAWLQRSMDRDGNQRAGDFAYFDIFAPQRALLDDGVEDVRLQHGSVGKLRPMVWFPSRLRLAQGVSLMLDEIPANSAKTHEFDLTGVRMQAITGRVALGVDVPTARVAVKVQRVGDARARGYRIWDAHFAALRSDGSFELGVVPGRYVVQLLDLETMIAFHPEAEVLELPVAEDAPLQLRPQIHWLDVGVVEDGSGISVSGCGVRVTLTKSKNASSPFHGIQGARGDAQYREHPLGPGSETRWLVPAGPVKLHAYRHGDNLRYGRPLTGAARDQGPTLDLFIEEAEHTARLGLPALPPIGELEKRDSR